MRVEPGLQRVVEETYHEAAEEAQGRGLSLLTAHKEGVVAATMLLVALTGREDTEARSFVVALNLRPQPGALSLTAA